MTKDQIKHMVDRFLGWNLPADFTPDGGVHFSRATAAPSGTNLLTATQAEAMVRHMVGGIPSPVAVPDYGAALDDLEAAARLLRSRVADIGGGLFNAGGDMRLIERLDAALAKAAAAR